ncbi:transglycosylase SLT domain-containing protein [Streptantibioticus silvisoli]|nr:transglycosylase SLT domain-containing protein [Streptantibioticus silvisoli]
MTRKQKLSAAGIAVVGASILAGAVVPGSAQAAPAPQHTGTPTAQHTKNISTTNTDFTIHLLDTTTQHTKTHTKTHAKTHTKTHAKTTTAHTAKRHPAHKSIGFKTAARTTSAPNNLNGWIHQALSVMHKHHIPGSYDGIKRNALRESSGNPHAINNWDINAQKGIPSKGLLQVIPPTFATYHVAGTSKNIYNPVANIVAACNYAAHRYGSMDNVNSAY